MESSGNVLRATPPHASTGYHASTFTLSLRVPQNSSLHCAAGGERHIMPRHKDSNKRNRKKPRRKRERKSIQVSTKVTVLLYKQIEIIAVEEDRTIASVARYLMSVALELIKNMRSPLLRAAPHISHPAKVTSSGAAAAKSGRRLNRA